MENRKNGPKKGTAILNYSIIQLFLRVQKVLKQNKKVCLVDKSEIKKRLQKKWPIFLGIVKKAARKKNKKRWSKNGTSQKKRFFLKYSKVRLEKNGALRI